MDKIKIDWKPEDFAAAEAAMKRLGEIVNEAGDGMKKAFEGIGREAMAAYEQGVFIPWRDPSNPFRVDHQGFDLGYRSFAETFPASLSEEEKVELEAAAKRFSGYMEEALLGGTWTTSENDSSAGDLTIDDVMGAIERIGGFKPAVRGFWFVDCPAAYIQFCSQIEEMELASMTPGPQEERVPQHGRFLASMSLPIINFQKEAMGEREIIAERGESAAEKAKGLDWQFTVWPWFCNYPGIWIEMSDGNHKYYVVIAGRMVEVNDLAFVESEAYRELLRELARPSAVAAASARGLGLINELLEEE